MSDKIRSQHIARKALLYVRQSSSYQVTHNLESQKLQYAMQERGCAVWASRTLKSSTRISAARRQGR